MEVGMKNIPTVDYLASGHTACAGCANVLALKYILRALEGDCTIIIPACCCTIIEGMAPTTSTPYTPVFHTAFASAAVTAAGVQAGYELRGIDTTVVAVAGDGGTYDIGPQSLSGAGDRGDNIIHICLNNEMYGNTGGQCSGATSKCAITTTTPRGAEKQTSKKDMPLIMAAHGIPYVATASVGHPTDLIRKVQRARDMKGCKYIEIITPCTSGWGFDPSLTIQYAKLAYQTGIFPLMEIINGTEYTINAPRKGKTKPLIEFLKGQGRFATITPESTRELEQEVHAKLAYLEAMTTLNTSDTV